MLFSDRPFIQIRRGVSAYTFPVFSRIEFVVFFCYFPDTREYVRQT